MLYIFRELQLLKGRALLHVKKHLGFNALRKTITEQILQIEDPDRQARWIIVSTTCS